MRLKETHLPFLQDGVQVLEEVLGAKAGMPGRFGVFFWSAGGCLAWNNEVFNLGVGIVLWAVA